MRTYLPNVEQLSQLFRTIGTIVLQLVDSHAPLALFQPLMLCLGIQRYCAEPYFPLHRREALMVNICISLSGFRRRTAVRCRQMSMKSIQLAFLLLVSTTAFSPNSAGAIVNGDFETSGIAPDVFAGWTTLDAGVFYARPTADTDPAGRFAVFTEPAPASLLLWSSYSAFRPMHCHSLSTT